MSIASALSPYPLLAMYKPSDVPDAVVESVPFNVPFIYKLFFRYFNVHPFKSAPPPYVSWPHYCAYKYPELLVLVVNPFEVVILTNGFTQAFLLAYFISNDEFELIVSAIENAYTGLGWWSDLFVKDIYSYCVPTCFLRDNLCKIKQLPK